MRNASILETTSETTLRRPTLKELAKQVIDRQPLTSDADVRRAIGKAVDAARLTDFRAALTLGRLHLCGNCAHFTFAADPTDPGTCTLFGHGLVPFAMPFYCAKFEVSATPTAPEYLPDPDGKLALERELAKPVLSSVSIARVFRNRDGYG